MKKIASLIVAIAMAASVSVANAADNIWLTLISSSDASIVADSQGPGQALVLRKPNAGAATVRVGLNITSESNSLAGYSFLLNSSTGGTFANGTAFGTGYNQVLSDITNGSTTADFGRGSSDNSGSVGIVYQFDVVLTGNNLPVNITGDFGASGVYIGVAYWYGFVGPNPISFGGPNYVSGPDTTPGWGSLPIMSVVVPEPTTLVLLGLGAVALIRRRK